MTWGAVVDAWVEELTDSIPALDGVIVHLYASWSLEELFASTGERHLAVWPASEAEVATGMTTQPADVAVQAYAVLVWEAASAEGSRLKDNQEADLAWLELHEAIRARFYRTANLRLGDPNIVDTRYQGVVFDKVAGYRAMALRFNVRLGLPYA